jgi:hypothetical protein
LHDGHADQDVVIKDEHGPTVGRLAVAVGHRHARILPSRRLIVVFREGEPGKVEFGSRCCWERSGGRMPQRKFANQKALIDYAEQNGLVYVWAWIERQRVISPAFTKRKRLLSPDQYEIVDVRTSRGVRTAMLFPKAILQAEFAANAPLREVLAIQRERLRAKRAEKQRTT